MHKLYKYFIFSLMLLFLQSQNIAIGQTPPSKDKVNFLFVVAAKKGIVSKQGNSYVLTLKMPDNKVLYFSDRPTRLAGHIALSKFIIGWTEGKDSFKKVPPNAVLVHSDSEKGDVLELMDITMDKTTNTVVFHLGLSFKPSQADYKEVFIFIDALLAKGTPYQGPY